MTLYRLRIILPAALSTCLVLATASPIAAETTSPANIILILVDDLDYAHVGNFENKPTPTPNIDSIATNGVSFTNAYVTCPVCGPSRVGILTGRYQDRIGYVTNHGPEIPENFGLPTTATIIAETLKDAGYATAMIGKWHLGFDPDKTPNARGFDYFFGHLHGYHDYNPGVQHPGPIYRNDQPVTTTRYLTRKFGYEAARFIARTHDKPYFLFAPFNAVHSPLQAPDETLEKFSHIKNKQGRTMAAMIHELDNAVGEILKAVKESGNEDNTLIVFTNDNGGVAGSNPRSNGELRAGKGSLYEGGIRVPMFLQWKTRVDPATSYDHPISALDLAPTFAAAAQTTSTVKYEGANLLPHLKGTIDTPPHTSLFWHFIDAPNQKAVRKGPWKAIQPSDDAPWELYNLTDEVSELNNLAGRNKAKLEELTAEWEAWSQENVEPLFMDVRILRKRESENTPKK